MVDTSLNFWEVHPSLKAAGPFKEIWKKDRTRGKDRSSKIAWCIALIWDRKSDFYNLEIGGKYCKLKLVFGDFFGDKNFYTKEKELVDDLRDFYIESTTTVAQRTLVGIEEKLKERDKFIRNTPYDMGEIGDRGAYVGGTVDTLDKMMANTEKLYSLYDKARKIVDQEMQQSTMGGAEQSLSDSGEI